MDLNGDDTHLDHLRTGDDVTRSERLSWESEFADRAKQPTGVFFGRANENVQISGETRSTVERQCVSASNHEFNVPRAQ